MDSVDPHSSSNQTSRPPTLEQNPEIVLKESNNSKPSLEIIKVPSKDLPVEERLKLENWELPKEVLNGYAGKPCFSGSWSVFPYLKC